jgi:2-oxoisovalerate dehydrogenase E2 component (dihydrolipoyl transacylase)
MRPRRPGAGPRPCGLRRAPWRRGHPRHRPAPQDCAEDAGVQAPHPAFQLRRGNRRDRARSLARQAQQLHGATRGKLTVLPFLARAMVLALREFPQINARYDDEAGVVTRYAGVHLGVATQTEGGLMVPVLRHAESLDLWACAAGIAAWPRARAVARRRATRCRAPPSPSPAWGRWAALPARRSSTTPRWPSSASTAWSSGPCCGVARWWALLMNLSSSFDHRVVDGMHAAQFIQAMRALLETPALLFVE